MQDLFPSTLFLGNCICVSEQNWFLQMPKYNLLWIQICICVARSRTIKRAQRGKCDQEVTQLWSDCHRLRNKHCTSQKYYCHGWWWCWCFWTAEQKLAAKYQILFLKSNRQMLANVRTKVLSWDRRRLPAAWRETREGGQRVQKFWLNSTAALTALLPFPSWQ